METKKNADGSYEVVLGNSSVRNKNGLVFPPELLRNEITKLNQRAERGTALGELGFPKRRAGEAVDHFRTRVLTIDLERVCARFVDFRVEQDNPEDPRIVATVRPVGPHGEIARQVLDAPTPDVYFGARFFADAFTQDGAAKLSLNHLITFDLVSEPV